MVDGIPTIERDWPRIERHIRLIDTWDVECYRSRKVISHRLSLLRVLKPYFNLLGIKTVLDVGAAGITRKWWIKNGYTWSGITFPKDAAKLREAGIDVDVGDVASMPYGDGQFDLVYASHVVEHSAMPLVALMECARVGRYMVLSTPRYPRHLRDPYHYAIVPRRVWTHWIRLADWFVAADFSQRRDFRFLCVKDLETKAKVRTLVKKQARMRRIKRRRRPRVKL